MKTMPNIGYIRLNEVWRIIIKNPENPMKSMQAQDIVSEFRGLQIRWKAL